MILSVIILYLFFAIAFLIEAEHDFLISSFKQTKEQSKKWHRLDWQYLAVIGVGVGFAGGDFEMNMSRIELISAIVQCLSISIGLAVLKPLVFNIRINKLFKHEWNYVGNNGIESKFKGKESLYYLLCFFILALAIATIVCINVLIIN